jgi:hypothetical protein
MAKKKSSSDANVVNAERKSAKKPPKAKPWTFPKNSLEEAIAVPKAIEEKNGGNPMSASDLAKAVGFRQPQDWRFLELLRSANQYGLVHGTGATARVALQKAGEDIVAPSSPSQRQRAMLDAFHNVEDFKRVAEFYGNKRIPEDEYFVNTLVRDFNIDRDRVDVFAKTFRDNLAFLGSFDAAPAVCPSATSPADTSGGETEVRAPKPARVREFLDTCFVMMPFGDWFDRYYQEIYVPAIKEAGFEPVRADELFTTGSVVEQIWEQIQKSSVLLADVSEKNANVFYELGLAHAACKPAVLAAGQLEDVPFDLRHLRVIIYDVREPQWSDKLKKSVTDYLKNAKSDPDKSIPQPFRTLVHETA